jgi:NTE family protein
MATEFSGRRIGLALGGGAVLGAAHIGVLKAFEALQIKIHCIAGTSVGAVVATLYAFGIPLSEIEHFALHVKWHDTSRLHLSKMGLLSNESLGRMVQGWLGNACLQDAAMPLAIVATDIERAEKLVLCNGDIKTAIMASTCVPGVFVPVETGGRILVDGGLLENVPLSPLCSMGADFRIGVDLTARREYPRPHHIFDVMINSIELALSCSTRIQTQAADLLICPDLSVYSFVDTGHVQELIEKGYEAARQALLEGSGENGCQ